MSFMRSANVLFFLLVLNQVSCKSRASHIRNHDNSEIFFKEVATYIRNSLKEPNRQDISIFYRDPDSVDYDSQSDSTQTEMTHEWTFDPKHLDESTLKNISLIKSPILRESISTRSFIESLTPHMSSDEIENLFDYIDIHKNKYPDYAAELMAYSLWKTGYTIEYLRSLVQTSPMYFSPTFASKMETFYKKFKQNKHIDFKVSHLQFILFVLESYSLSEVDFTPYVRADKFAQFFEPFPFDDNDVRYFAEEGVHSYLNEKLEDRIRLLSNLAYVAPDSFKSVFFSLEEVKKNYWKQLESGPTQLGKIQPFNLLQVKLTQVLVEQLNLKNHAERQSFRVRMGYFAEDLLNELLQTGRPIQLPTLLFINNPNNDSSASLICRDQEALVLERIVGRGFVYVGTMSNNAINKLEVTIQDLHNSQVRCGNKTYIASAIPMDSKGAKKPSLPFKGSHIHAVSYVALISEMNLAVLYGGISYLAANGFATYKIEFIDDTRSDFQANQSKVNVIIPVDHALHANKITIGSKRSIKLRAMSLSGGKTIYLDIYLPPLDQQSQRQYLDESDIMDIICDSQCRGDSPLSVFHVSCYSSSTIHAWNQNYLLAKNKRGYDGVTPLVYATDRGFDTRDPYIILSHLDYPLQFLRGLQKGLGVEEIENQLRKEPQGFARLWLKRMSYLQSNKKSEAGVFNYYLATRYALHDFYNQTAKSLINTGLRFIGKQKDLHNSNEEADSYQPRCNLHPGMSLFEEQFPIQYHQVTFINKDDPSDQIVF